MFRVLAENRFGRSDPLDSSAVMVQYPFSRPGIPGQPEVINCTREMVTITWQGPTTDGGIFDLRNFVFSFVLVKQVEFYVVLSNFVNAPSIYVNWYKI